MSTSLNAAISRKAPYEETEVNFTRTKGEIELMLRSYNFQGIRWTWVEGQDDVLEFLAVSNINGVKKQIKIAVSPPHIILQRKSGPKENIDQEYRLLFYWLKAKVEAVIWGLSTVEDEFLSKIAVTLPDGSATTVGAQIKELIATDRMASLPYFGTDQRQPTPQGQDRNPDQKPRPRLDVTHL